MSTSLHRIALSLAVAVACTIGGIDGADAQRAPSKGASATNETDRALDGAAKAIDAGNADAAMSALEGILSRGGLSNNHMARALYLRGLAHRKKGRQAQAIADLTSAVWLKDGLSETDRNAALAARSEASREVGVAAPPASGGSTASAPSTSANPEAAPQSAPWARVAAAPRSTGDSLSEAGFPRRAFSTPAPAPSADTSANSASPASGPATSSWQSGTTVDANERRQSPQPRQQARAEPPPPSAAPANPPSSGGGFGSFFSGLFTGNSAATQASQDDAGGSAQWRPRTEPSARPEQRATKAAEPKAPVKTAKVAEPTRARKGESRIATSAIASGAYKLQIATVRSRKEADTVAAKVRQDYSGAIGQRQLEVDETVFGGMGKFYRVRLGPYANVSEPKALCDQLRPKGYDCLVVTN